MSSFSEAKNMHSRRRDVAFHCLFDACENQPKYAATCEITHTTAWKVQSILIRDGEVTLEKELSYRSNYF